MLESLDNSNGIQYYGGNDPAKMGGRIKKGQVAGGGRSREQQRRRERVTLNVANSQFVRRDVQRTREQNILRSVERQRNA
jgi:hypothetical protein